MTSIKVGGYLDEGYNIVVMFDGCDEHFVSYFERKYPFIVVCHNKGKAYGFAKNANIGLRYAHKHGMDCFVLNMDTVLPRVEWLDAVRGEGLSTPTMIDIENPTCEKVTMANEGQLYVLGDEKNRERKPSHKFAGFCIHFSVPLMDKIGYLDEGFIATFEDDDVCIRANLAGFPCEEVDVKVHHYINNRSEVSTTGAYTNFRMQCSKLRFQMKWGTIPATIPHAEYPAYIFERFVWDDRMRCS